MIPIQVNRDNHMGTFTVRARDVRSACRRWLSMEFSVDGIDTMMNNQENTFIGEEFLEPGIVYMPHIPATEPIIAEFTPRVSIRSRYALVNTENTGHIYHTFEITNSEDNN